MSNERDPKLDAIDEVLRLNADMPAEFRIKLERLRNKFEESAAARRKTFADELERQRVSKEQEERTREEDKKRLEDAAAFHREWIDQTRKQTELLRRIAAKL